MANGCRWSANQVCPLVSQSTERVLCSGLRVDTLYLGPHDVGRVTGKGRTNLTGKVENYFWPYLGVETLLDLGSNVTKVEEKQI